MRNKMAENCPCIGAFGGSSEKMMDLEVASHANKMLRLRQHEMKFKKQPGNPAKHNRQTISEHP